MSETPTRLTWEAITLHLHTPFHLSYGVSETRRAFWQRALDPRRIGPRWYLVILGAYPLLTLLILSAALFHFSVNLTGNLLVLSAAQETVRLILLAALAGVVILAYGPRHLSRARSDARADSLWMHRL